MSEYIEPEVADYKARLFVNGGRRHGLTGDWVPAAGEFSANFIDHPWVRQSITEGWDRELRGHLVHTIKRRIMNHLPYTDINGLMPDQGWVDAARHNAARYRAAKEWRDEKYGKTDGEAMLLRLGIMRPSA